MAKNTVFFSTLIRIQSIRFFMVVVGSLLLEAADHWTPTNAYLWEILLWLELNFTHHSPLSLFSKCFRVSLVLSYNFPTNTIKIKKQDLKQWSKIEFLNLFLINFFFTFNLSVSVSRTKIWSKCFMYLP